MIDMREKISPKCLAGLHQILREIDEKKIIYVNFADRYNMPNDKIGLNMNWWGEAWASPAEEHMCGTVFCFGGMLEARGQFVRNAKYDDRHNLNNLFHPPQMSDLWWAHITIAIARKTLDRLLNGDGQIVWPDDDQMNEMINERKR